MTVGQRSYVPEGLVPGAAGFAERGWIADEVAAWRDHGTERIFLLTGNAGSGKSVISGWLTGRGGWDAVYFCSDRYVGASPDPRTFTREVSAQLRRSHAPFEAALRELARPLVQGEAHANLALGEVTGVLIEKLFVEAKTTDDLYDIALGSPLATTLAGADRQFVLLIDGLDESLGEEEPTIAHLVAKLARIPGPLKLFLTSQNDREVTDEFRSLQNTAVRHLDLSAPEFATRVDEDIERFASSAAKDVVARRRVRDAARGNFLVARAALDEIAAGTPPSELEALVGGDLAAHHERHLVRMLKRAYGDAWRDAWEDGLRDLFGLLAVALYRVEVAALARWLGRSEPDVASTLDRFEGLVPCSDGNVGVYHAAFAAAMLAPRLGDGALNRVQVDAPRAHRCIVERTMELVESEGWAAVDGYALRNLSAHLAALDASPLLERAFALLAQPDYRRQITERVPDPIAAGRPYRRLSALLLRLRRYDLLERLVRDVAGSDLPALRATGLEALLGLASEDARRAGVVIGELARSDDPARRLLAMRAATRLPRDAQAAVFDEVVTDGDASVAREVAYAIYLNWSTDPARLTGDVLHDLAGRVSLRPPWRSQRARLAFLSDVTVTNYVNHLGDADVAELTSALWRQILVDRLHVNRLVPLLGRVVAPAVGRTVSMRILAAATDFERARARELFPFTGPDADAAARVVQRLDPDSDLLTVETDLATLFDSEFVLFRILAAQVLAVHAVKTFDTVAPLLDRLFEAGSPRVRAWLTMSLGVLMLEVPPAWLAPLERMTERIVADDPTLATVRNDRMLSEFDVLFFPLGLAYARAAQRLTLHERLVLDPDTDSVARASCITGIAVTGLYFPEAALAALEPAVTADERFLEQHAVEALGLIANLHPDLVELWLRRWDAAHLQDAVEATPLDAAHRYIELIGLYANGVHQSLNYPLMRERLHMSVFTNLLAAKSPEQWISRYTRGALTLLRDADYTLINWTKA